MSALFDALRFPGQRSCRELARFLTSLELHRLKTQEEEERRQKRGTRDRERKEQKIPEENEEA